MKNIRQLIDDDLILICDGATGTNLQARGLQAGQPAEMWILEKPDEIIRLHSDFIEAGADLLLTNTFGCNTIRLEQYGLSHQTEVLNQKAVSLARKAIGEKNILLAGSIGPTGHMLKPLGDLDEATAEQAYHEQAGYLLEAEVDFLVIETQFSLEEAKIAIQAVRSQNTEIPLVCSFSYDRGTRTMMGVKPAQMVKEIGALEVDLLGINCGRSLGENLKVLKEVKTLTDKPIWFKPNAGLPELDAQGKAIYNVTPDEMGNMAEDWVQEGARVIGGCCGTSPQHLKRIAQKIKQRND